MGMIITGTVTDTDWYWYWLNLRYLNFGIKKEKICFGNVIFNRFLRDRKLGSETRETFREEFLRLCNCDFTMIVKSTKMALITRTCVSYFAFYALLIILLTSKQAQREMRVLTWFSGKNLSMRVPARPDPMTLLTSLYFCNHGSDWQTVFFDG